MGITGPYKRLTTDLPTGTLVSVAVLVSVLGSIAIQLSFTLGMFLWMQGEPWYKPYNVHQTSLDSYEGTVLFLFTIIQYLVTAVAFSRSKPFRAPLYKNLYFTVPFVILTIYSYYLIVYPDMDSIHIFGIMTLIDPITKKERNALPFDFRTYMAGMSVINGLVTYIFEKVIVWWIQNAWYRRKDRIVQMKIETEHRKDMEMVASEMNNGDSLNISN